MTKTHCPRGPGRCGDTETRTTRETDLVGEEQKDEPSVEYRKLRIEKTLPKDYGGTSELLSKETREYHGHPETMSKKTVHPWDGRVETLR